MSSSELELEKGLFLYERGLELVEQEAWNEALLRFEKALDIFEKVGSEVEISSCLKALGKIHGFLGRWVKASEYFERDLEIQKRIGNEQEIMEDMDNLISYYTKSFNFEKAISQLEQVHSIFEKSKKHQEVVHVKSCLGQIYETMGEWDQALTNYKMAFELGEKLDLPATIKLHTKIRELINWKNRGGRVPTSHETQLSPVEVRTVGGVQVEPRMEHYAEVLSDLDELGKKKILGREEEEIESAQAKIWVPVREIPLEELKLYLDMVYPETLEINKEYFLRVVLGEEIKSSREIGLLSLIREKIGNFPVEVLLIAPGFDIVEPRKKLEFLSDKELKPLIFGLIPRNIGKCQFSLEFYHIGRMQLKLLLNVFVKKENMEVFTSRKKIELPLYSDLELDATLRIYRVQNKFYFHIFTRHTSDLTSEDILFSESELDEITWNRLQLQMRNLTFDEEHPQRAMTILNEIGRKVYNLIPEGIRKTINHLNPRYLLIDTEDPFVPFELAYDGQDFLCLKYCLGKRILSENANFEAPPIRIGDDKLKIKLIIAEPERILPEKEFLISVGASGLLNLEEVVEKANRKGLIEALSGTYDIIHLICLGLFNEKMPTESKLLLCDDAVKLKEIENIKIGSRSLIFANIREKSTDHKESGIRTFLGKTTIARAFLNSGASALIISLFRIPEHLASEITIKFYQKIILNGKQLGLIMREIKKELKQKYPGVLWAAFNLYGDPTLKLTPKK